MFYGGSHFRFKALFHRDITFTHIHGILSASFEKLIHFVQNLYLELKEAISKIPTNTIITITIKDRNCGVK